VVIYRQHPMVNPTGEVKEATRMGELQSNYAMALRWSAASAAVLPGETLERRRLGVYAKRNSTCV
jgi:hypothetical protein